MDIYKKLLEVKKKVPYIKKDKKGFNYTYATPSAVFGMINPILNEAGILLITEVVNSNSYAIVTGKGEKQKTEWKYDLDFIFTWVDVSDGEKINIQWRASGVNGEDKGLGSALTYAERYFILKQFNIPTDDDDPDNFQDKHTTAEVKAERVVNAKAAAIADLLLATTLEAVKAIWEANKPFQSQPDFVKAKDDAKERIAAAAFIAAWQQSVNDCNTEAELTTLFEGNKPTTEQPEIKALFTARNKAIKNIA